MNAESNQPASLASQLGRGARSSAVADALRRAESINPECNALTEIWPEAAEAEVPNGSPLAGVPIAIKVTRAVAGRQTTWASDFSSPEPAAADHPVVARIRGAGMVPIGASNSPEFALGGWCWSRRYGPTKNPLDLSLTPGGSSGGAAAAVASGIVSAAHATDVAGSARTPAAACGLVGLKPSRGRVTYAPGLGIQLYATDGAITRTVLDAAIMLDILSEPEPGDFCRPPEPSAPLRESCQQPPARSLTIAATLEPVLEGSPDEAAIRVHNEAIELLRDLGHSVEIIENPVWRATQQEIYGQLTILGSAGTAALINEQAALLARQPTEADLEPLTWLAYCVGNEIKATEMLSAESALQKHGRKILAWAQQFDAVLTPALTGPPPPWAGHDPLTPAHQRQTARGWNSYFPLANWTGQPAITLPTSVRQQGEGNAGMPVGIQLVGRSGGEAQLLAIANSVELKLG